MDDGLPVGHPQKPSLDHIVPHALGGETSEANSMIICSRCNRRKGVGPLPPADDVMLPGTDDW